jgi:hypothetical protein
MTLGRNNSGSEMPGTPTAAIVFAIYVSPNIAFDLLPRRKAGQKETGSAHQFILIQLHQTGQYSHSGVSGARTATKQLIIKNTLPVEYMRGGCFRCQAGYFINPTRRWILPLSAGLYVIFIKLPPFNFTSHPMIWALNVDSVVLSPLTVILQ